MLRLAGAVNNLSLMPRELLARLHCGARF
ncbi:MAG: hypothetical protein ACI9TA_003615, partial [Reinekea sp.]